LPPPPGDTNPSDATVENESEGRKWMDWRSREEKETAMNPTKDLKYRRRRADVMCLKGN